MAAQTSVKGTNGTEIPPGKAMRMSLADFAHDLTTLAELQGRLFVLDARETARQMIVPIALAVVSAALALGCIPVGLMGFAWVLVFQAEWSYGTAFLATAAVALLIAGGISLLAWMMVRDRLTVMNRSKEEFSRNLTWIRKVLKNSGRTWRSDQCATDFEAATREFRQYPR